jgi:cytochrome b subunit of formate dehydrogenase
VKGLLLHIRSEKKYPMPPRVQFNPAQKAWYLYAICILFPVLGITGIIQWLGLDYNAVGASFLSFVILIHMIFALITDLLLLVHIYIKYLRNWAIVCFDIFKVFKEKRHLIYPLLYGSPSQVKKYSNKRDI